MRFSVRDSESEMRAFWSSEACLHASPSSGPCTTSRSTRARSPPPDSSLGQHLLPCQIVIFDPKPAPQSPCAQYSLGGHGRSRAVPQVVRHEPHCRSRPHWIGVGPFNFRDRGRQRRACKPSRCTGALLSWVTWYRADKRFRAQIGTSCISGVAWLFVPTKGRRLD